MTELERRFFSSTLELRAEEGQPTRIVGYGAIFNSISEDLGGFREIIELGAFDDVLSDDVRSLFNHDANLILGRSSAGTLTLEVDDLGLRYTITPPDTSYAHDLVVVMKRGDVNQSSFAFHVAKNGDVWEEPTNERPYYLRRVRKLDRLYDVSPVTFPAYPSTSSTARDYLQSLLAGRATDQDGDPGAAGRLAMRRRKLELLTRL